MNKNKLLMIIVVVILIAVPAIYFAGEYFKLTQTSQTTAAASNYSTYFYLNPISSSEVDSYKSSTTDESVEDVIQNPKNYKGQKIKETGRIVNMTYNNDGYTEFLLWTPDTNRNFTRLFTTYKGKTPYNIGDNIAVYGEVDTYTIYGLSMSFLKAVYIEKL